MEIEDITTKADQLAAKMNKITASFTKNADTTDEMCVAGDELIDLVTEVVEKSDNDMQCVDDVNKKLVTRSEALNLKTLVDDFSYVRNVLKTNADSGKRIIANLTLSILDFDEESDLANKALLITSFADINKSVAINMDLYLKTYKEISTILLQLDKIKDTQEKLSGDESPRKEKEVNTTDLIKQLNTIED